MPRLLSNKTPERKFETIPRLLSNKAPETNKGQVIISSTNKDVSEMNSWEYYCFLMRFGKRKMDRDEWLT